MKHKHLVILLAGLVMAVTGFVLLRGDSSWAARPVPYLLLGFGCGAFGWGAGELLKRKALAGDPALERKLRIQQEDERNQAIADRAKARTYDASLYLYGALLTVFALMKVDFVVIMLLVGAYLAVNAISIYYYCKYQREM